MKFNEIKCLSILKKSRPEEKGDVSYCEEYIATNLDYFLENYSKEMREMKTTTLYNIFNHKQRKLKNHERAYKFIKEVANSGKDSDCVEMSEESTKAFSNKEKNYGFLPEFNLSFISDIKSQMNTIMNQQIQMMNVIGSMLNEKINSVHDNRLLLSQKIDEINDKIEDNNMYEKIENEKTKNEIESNTEKINEGNEKENKKIEESNKNATRLYF